MVETTCTPHRVTFPGCVHVFDGGCVAGWLSKQQIYSSRQLRDRCRPPRVGTDSLLEEVQLKLGNCYNESDNFLRRCRIEIVAMRHCDTNARRVVARECAATIPSRGSALAARTSTLDSK